MIYRLHKWFLGKLSSGGQQLYRDIAYIGESKLLRGNIIKGSEFPYSKMQKSGRTTLRQDL